VSRESSDASPRGLPTSGVDVNIRSATQVSSKPSTPGPSNMARAGITQTKDRQPQLGDGYPQDRPALTSVTSHPFTRRGLQTLSTAKAETVASPSPTPSNRSVRSMRPPRVHRDLPVRSAFSAIACVTGRREAKRQMITTTGFGKTVSSHSELVSTCVGLPPRDTLLLARLVLMMRSRA